MAGISTVNTSNYANGNISINTDTLHFVLWAEEGGLLANNNTQWSYGNGATGLIGVTMVGDWELYALTFQGENINANGSAIIRLWDIEANVPITPALITTTPGQKIFRVGYSPTIVIPETTLGFKTISRTATVGDIRVAAWLKRSA